MMKNPDPLSVLFVPVSVYTPDPAVNALLFVIFPLTVTAAFALLIQVPPAFTVMSLNVFVPPVLLMFNVPEMLVAPLTVREVENPLMNSVPVLTVSDPLTRAVLPPLNVTPDTLLLVNSRLP
jgi:hypothetical protein